MGAGIDWRAARAGGLEIALTDTGDSEVFGRFFDGYDRAFVLPNEKEDIDGLRDCLALNHGAEKSRLEAEYGAFRELCLIARDAESDAFVGGANFIVFEVAGDDHALTSANLNYIFVDHAQRGKGYFSRLVDAVRATIRVELGDRGDPLVFIELNDPLRMSAEDYVRDTRFTGLDQIVRIRIWAKRGARIVDHPYIQPALSDDAEPDDTLIYGVLTDRANLPACSLRDHLRKFFGISVRKGEPLSKDRVASEQIAVLDTMCAAGKRIALLDPAPFLKGIAGRDDIERLLAKERLSAREAIRNMLLGN